MANLCNLFNPERIVVGGDLGAAGELLLEPLREAMRRRAIRSAAEDVEVVPGASATAPRCWELWPSCSTRRSRAWWQANPWAKPLRHDVKHHQEVMGRVMFPTTRKAAGLAAVAVLAIGLVVAGCGSSSKSS